MTATREDEIQLNRNRGRGRRAKEMEIAVPLPERIPRIARLMALAIKFQDMVDRGEVRDYADLARLGFVTRARLTQIMNLTLLAPEIQEEILDHHPEKRPSVNERHIRRVVTAADWFEQKRRWKFEAQR